MKAKKLIAVLLAVVMLFSLTGNFALAAPTEGGYHYDQLDALAKTIYNGIGQMDLTTGTDEYDLANDLAVIPGNTELNKAMNAARYAYYADYPEVFYVDFPKLTLRTTQDASGNKHVYIGSGRNASYLVGAFADKAAVDAAIAEFDARVAEIVKGAEGVTDESGKSLQAAQIKYVHNEIITNVSYRLEDTAAHGNASLLGTPYGVLVRKQGVCEGYSRAFKAVMDELGINCILVQGVHQYDGELAVNHMWNYVEITDGATARAGGKWYAVDATLDDPEIPIASASVEYNKYHNNFEQYGDDGFEQEKYLLAGQLTMNEEHFEAEEVNAAGGYHFDYPPLEDNDFTVTDISNDLDGFSVITKDVVSAVSGETITEFQFNYLGMTATEAKKKGIYLVWRYYNEEDGLIVPEYGEYGSWFYIDTDSYVIKEEHGCVCIQEGNRPYVEIAATTTPPSDTFPKSLTYLGEDSGLIARTGKLYNPNRTGYVAPPFVFRQTPTQSATIEVSDRFYHIMAEFDETLVPDEGYTAEDIRTRITCRDRYGAGVTGAEYSEIRNFEWDGDKTVEFDMKFSTMYSDSNVIYNIYLEGLVGQTSGKIPNPIVYTTRIKGPCPSIMERDGNWDVFAKPTLLEGDDLSLNGWQTSSGQPVNDLLSHRLTLVTTRTTEAQNEQIAEQVEDKVTDNILDSETYNIALSICKSMIIKTGDRVKVRLGFPAGYGPDDEGVTFKAYHFKRDTQGNVIDVEEIGCVVTQYGLIITCDAFSPFMIAAVEKDETAVEDKTVVVTTSDGGTVSGAGLDASGIVKLSENGSQTVTYTAREGYQIESVTVCGREIDLTNKKSAAVTVNYSDVQNANNIVNASFVAEEVVLNEERKNESPVKPVAEAAEITMPASKTVAEGETLKVEPTVSAQADSVQSFQWYKDGVKLEGKISKNLEIKNAAADDAGKYTLKVTTTVDTVSAEATSSECLVTVTPNPGGSVSTIGGFTMSVKEGKGTVNVTPTDAKEGDTVTVTGNPEEGYKLDKLTVLDEKGVELKTEKKSDTEYTFTMPAGKVTIEAVFVEKGNASFTDIAENAYYYDAVLWAVEKGITNGTTSTTFSPNNSCTRAQTVTFLWRASGSPKATGSNPFTDVKSDAYYYDAVLWAVEKGITKGKSDTTFAPNEIVTRSQTVTFLYRANGSPAASGTGFADVSTDAYYASAVIWASTEGITKGTSETAFSPDKDCTRGQIVTFLYRDAQ